MNWPFVIIAALTLASASCAMALRNLVHCVLSLMVTFTGLACLYLQLHAEFVGLVQVLVYIGAVAILIVFAILLTRNSSSVLTNSPSWVASLGVVLLVAGTLLFSVLNSTALARPPAAAEVSTKQIGEQLMTRYLLPLEVVALLLTAAMIGAVIIALQEKKKTGSTGVRHQFNATSAPRPDEIA
jgi:NADH-quinone oxidoreductase subunit J